MGTASVAVLKVQTQQQVPSRDIIRDESPAHRRPERRAGFGSGVWTPMESTGLPRPEMTARERLPR